MAKDFDAGFSLDHLSSASRVHESGDRPTSLSRHIRNLLQKDARDRIRIENAAPLVDNSGGVAGGDYASVDSAVLSDNDLTGLTTGVTAASLNTAADTVMDAYAVLMERLNDVVFASLGAGSADEGPGTIAASGTVAVIDDTATANTGNTDAATTASARAVQRDLLHAQRVVIQAIDDARVMVGLARQFDTALGLYDGTGNLTFAAGPDTITRSAGSWLADGFRIGDEVEIPAGTNLNNFEGRGSRRTISALTPTVMTFSGTGLSAETVTGGELDAVVIRTVKQGEFVGRLAGAAPGPALDETVSTDFAVAGADWTFEFETGAAGISNAVNGADATSAVLLAEWDAFVDELSDNIALMADLVDAITNGPVDAAAVETKIPFVIPATEYAAGTSVFVTSPVGGRIRQIESFVSETTTGVGTITVEINGSAVTGASLVVATASGVGTYDTDAVADTGNPGDANANFVDKGQRIELVGDGVPTAGAIWGWVTVVETGETDDNLAGYAA